MNTIIRMRMKRVLRQLAFTFPILVLTVAVAAHAQSTCGSGSTSGTLCSPSSYTSFQSFLSAVFTALVKISLPIITVFIVYSGFLFVTAQGNKTKLEVAKRNFLFVIIGALLILAAWILAQIIAGTLLQVVGSS